MVKAVVSRDILFVFAPIFILVEKKKDHCKKHALRRLNIKDHLGSTRAAVSENAAGTAMDVAEAFDFYPYGKQIPLVMAVKPTTETFTGKEYDYEGYKTGAPGIDQYYFGARYYDPEAVVWGSVDPMRQYWSPYNYCGNNPINRVDPTGLLDDSELQGRRQAAEDKAKRDGTTYWVAYNALFGNPATEQWLEHGGYDGWEGAGQSANQYIATSTINVITLAAASYTPPPAGTVLQQPAPVTIVNTLTTTVTVVYANGNAASVSSEKPSVTSVWVPRTWSGEGSTNYGDYGYANAKLTPSGADPASVPQVMMGVMGGIAAAPLVGYGAGAAVVAYGPSAIAVASTYGVAAFKFGQKVYDYMGATYTKNFDQLQLMVNFSFGFLGARGGLPSDNVAGFTGTVARREINYLIDKNR